MAEVTTASQKFVEIKEIKDGVVYLKGGGMRKVLIVSGVNFDLKSEIEQGIILNTFQGFINTLEFSVQFFIHSRKVNINNYLEKMAARKAEETNELMKVQVDDYIEFIRSFVEQNAIISKNFFVIVPYEAVSVATETKGIFDFFKKSTPKPAEKSNNEQENIEQLNQRTSQIMDGLVQIGLQAAPLGNEELIELFYNLYNPQLTEKKGIGAEMSK